MKKGKIYLLPNTLGSEGLGHIIPNEVGEIASGIRYFAVEEIKSARRLLRKIDREFPIDDSHFIILNKRTPSEELYGILKHVIEGNDMAIISEAGCPGIADPGSSLVALAHQNEVQVCPMTGPSSILLALIGSGFNGQEFTFHGYLPKERKDRIRKLRELEGNSRKTRMSNIRNMHVLDDMLNELSDDTALCIASNLTLPSENIQTRTVKKWRDHAYNLGKIPVIFIIGKMS